MIITFPRFVLATKNRKNRMAEIKLWIRKRRGPRSVRAIAVLSGSQFVTKWAGMITVGTDRMEQRQSYMRGLRQCSFHVLFFLLFFGLKKLDWPGFIKA